MSLIQSIRRSVVTLVHRKFEDHIDQFVVVPQHTLDGQTHLPLLHLAAPPIRALTGANGCIDCNRNSCSRILRHAVAIGGAVLFDLLYGHVVFQVVIQRTQRVCIQCGRVGTRLRAFADQKQMFYNYRYTRAETDELYQALSGGSEATMPLQELFGGGYFGICVDKFGIRWMFNCANKDIG